MLFKIIKIILNIILITEVVIIIFVLAYPLEEVEQPKTFLENESYQLAKWSKGTYGGICYQYADRLKRLFGEANLQLIKSTGAIIAIKDSGGTTRYLTCQEDPDHSGKYILTT
jgi:hypothetical protein